MSPAFLLSQGGELKHPYAEHPWVYRAATVIANNLAGVPFRIYSGDPEDPQEQTGTEWNALFANPNPEQTARQFWVQSWLLLLLRGGECFWWLKAGAADGQLGESAVPRWMWPYSGRMFEEKVNKRTGILEGWKLNLGTGEPKVLEPYEVVHLRFENPYNQRRGLSPYDAAERSVRTDVKAHEWNEAGLDNGAVPGGVLSSKSGQGPDAKQAAMIRRQFNDMHQGASKAGRVAVLPNDLQYQPTGMTPKDLEFQGQREWSRQEISSVYGVPQFLLGILGDVHRETSREARKLFWEETLVPILRLSEDILTARLFMGRGQNSRIPTEMPTVWGKFDTSGIKALQSDEMERVNQAVALWKQGVSLEELNRRFELELEQQEGWETAFVPLGVEPVGFATKEPEPIPAVFGGPGGNDDQEEEEDEEEDEDRRAVAPAVRATSRRVQWETYIRRIQQPGEKRMQSRVLTWVRKVRRDVLKWIESGGRAFRQYSEGEMDDFLTNYADDWTRSLIETTAPVTEWIVGLSLDRLEGQIGSLSSASMTHPAILEFLDRQALRKSVIADTVKTQLRASLIDGLAQGQSVGASAADLRQILTERTAFTLGKARTRSLTIARTESGAASTGSRYAAYKAEGVEKHSWLTAGDGNERESHAAQDGVVVVIGDTFPNGLLYPLDENGRAEEVINCRCDTLPE